MIHRTLADYTTQPWKNGKGVTVELARADRDGAMLWRLSVATVSEDGPFSVFPDIERNLTVISGNGFRLTGDGIALDCAPLRPVAFAGDAPVSAVDTDGQTSTDFNVMTSRHLPRPEVAVIEGPCDLPAGGLLALFALSGSRLSDRTLAQHDLVMTEGPLSVIAGRVLTVRIFGL